MANKITQQFILIKKNVKTDSEYFYGPFKSMHDAWDWANSEFQWSKLSSNVLLSVKELYCPVTFKG